jgi:hypothetical protein
LREERKLRVFENRALRRIFGPKRDEVKKEWRNLHNEKLKDLYSTSNILRVIKSRRMKWAGHVARTGGERGVYRFWWENLRERDHLGGPGVDVRIILSWILRKWNLWVQTGWNWLRKGTGGGLL